MSESVATHQPFVAPRESIAELTLLPILLGTVLGVLFGTASLYLALKTGLTVSASIPVAVMSISIFRWAQQVFGLRRATILENNVVQTAGSAGESIAFGVAVTMPALMTLGFDMELPRIMTIALLGSALGILMMIPLRRGLVAREHGRLAFPEGTACAEVLIAGERGGTTAKTVFTGLGVGFLLKALNGDGGLALLKGSVERGLGWLKGGSVAMDAAPELLGVGYILGPRTAGIMCAGGVLSYLVLIPLIALVGESLREPLFPATQRVAEMAPGDIRNAYILYIGAGAVATGGMIALARVLPMLARAFVTGIGSLRGAAPIRSETAPRTDRDLSMLTVVLGSLALVGALMVVPALGVSLPAALLILAFGFLFVTVSSRLTGEVGSTSNPISGMTVATLLLTCLLFLAFGWTSPADRLTALSIAAVVCVASSNGGTTAQDLKTGFLVGATPRSQQIGILIGAGISALVIGASLQLFNDVRTVYAKREFPGVTIETVQFDGRETLSGPDAARDAASYNVAHLTADETPPGVPPGRYLVDDAGAIRYLVDPGINGVVTQRDDGTPVPKFDAPKARLMSLIIDGILTQKLPWGLVGIGAFIAITLELASISALPFAVGVYLPLSVSSPIFLGGLVRWWVERRRRKPAAGSADSDTSPGVLAASGLIAGGAIGGTVLALIAGANESFSQALGALGRSLPALSRSDVFALAAFALLAAWLWGVGREKLLAER
ncbi:MAG TPA: oligopeptide transporter, OPT family [Myxococcota bacterium]|nr:oligopeptide transporter, OPT family [Myxococcota bacterium]